MNLPFSNFSNSRIFPATRGAGIRACRLDARVETPSRLDLRTLAILCLLLLPFCLAAAPTVGPISPSPSSIPVAVSTSVTFTVAISGGTPLANGVNLLQEDSSGNVLNVVGVMSSTGSGNYQLTASFNPAQGTNDLYFQASAAFQGALQRVKSSVLTLPVTLTAITLNPTSLTFPTQVIGTTSAAQTFSITNSGNQAVAISSITASGDFAVSNNPCPANLAVGASCTVSITFKPIATGTRTGSVSITDNATGSPQSVSLTGTGQPVATYTLTINPTSLTFPAQTVGTTSAAQTFSITSSGNQAVTISSITSSGDFSVSNNPCPASLAVAASCTVSITFKPTATGTRNGSVSITDNATGSPQSVSLTGTGQPVATYTLTINPTSLTFPAQTVGTTSAAQTFSITNSGNQAVAISSITASGDFAVSNNPCPASLAVAASCTVSVTFKPTATGTRNGSVSITDNATGSPQSVSLTGTGQPVATYTLTINPTSLTFPAQTVGTTSTAQTFSITNSGNQAVTISSITASGDFAVSNNPCPASLAIAASCTVSVTFKPTATGTRNGSVSITDNATGSPQSVSLTGTGQPVATYTLTINPTSLTFPAQTVGTTSAAQTFSVTNSGNQAVTISAITASGDFAVSNNPCPASLAVAASCTVSVTFKPTAIGTRNGSVSITDNATGSPQSVSLTGTGQPVATYTLTINPTSLTFPAQTVGTTSAAQTFSITNSGNQAVAISSITASGDFAVSNNPCPASLAISASCTVSVTFRPTATGTRNGSVGITDNATGSPQSVSLTGIGQSATGNPTLTINPTSLTFPAQNVTTTSAAKTFSITNSGNQAATITSITASGDFAVSNNPCPASLAVSAACTVSVTFTPTAIGARTGAVTITDNATGSPQSVTLTGTGQPNGTATITSITPASGPIGTLVKLALSNFAPAQGIAPQVTLTAQGGGTISAPISTFSNTAVSFVVPAGAATGKISLTFGTQSATSASAFTVSTSSTFTLSVGPATANLIQGQSVSYAVTVNSTNGFDGLASLAVSGVPSGVQSSFKPTAVAAGQTSILTLTASANQSKNTYPLTFSASASIQAQSVSQMATASLSITGVTTTFLGRTVAADPIETPLTGVTVTTLGTDGSGNATSCNNYTAVSDAAGNFALTNLPSTCAGPQMISFGASKATGAPGKYGGARLIFALTNGQVTVAPVLVHLPRIDTAETVLVQQNASTNQTFFSSSVPGVSFTVYAGTTLTLPDGTQPNPFPMGFVPVLPDRLPYATSHNSTAFGAFYLSLQPNGTHASQPVAVTYPNVLNTPPGTKVQLMMALNSVNRGAQSVGAASASAQVAGLNISALAAIGTATVSADGSLIVPDADPAHPGHAFGESDFDW